MASERRKVRDTRLVLAVLLALSMGVNGLLSHGLAQRESMAVLVPAVSGPAWTVGETWAGRRYVEDTARTVAVTLLTLTPENAVEVREAAARMPDSPGKCRSGGLRPCGWSAGWRTRRCAATCRGRRWARRPPSRPSRNASSRWSRARPRSAGLLGTGH